MICLQTPSFGWSFQDGRQLASKPVHHNNELLDPVLFLRSVDAIKKPGFQISPVMHCERRYSQACSRTSEWRIETVSVVFHKYSYPGTLVSFCTNTRHITDGPYYISRKNSLVVTDTVIQVLWFHSVLTLDT